jgi:hypothetical protein
MKNNSFIHTNFKATESQIFGVRIFSYVTAYFMLVIQIPFILLAKPFFPLRY